MGRGGKLYVFPIQDSECLNLVLPNGSFFQAVQFSNEKRRNSVGKMGMDLTSPLHLLNRKSVIKH